MGRVTTRRRIQRLSAGVVRTRPDTLAVEEPLEIRIDDEPFVVTMRTPGNDVELATGFLLSEGVITRGEDVRAAIHCGGPGSGGEQNTYNVLDLSLAVPTPKPRSFYTTSACGVCGKDSIDSVRTVSSYDVGADSALLSQELLATLPSRLRAHQQVFDKTGGTHAAGLFTYAGELIAVREDVGRHNAVDKVIGWAALNGKVPLTETVLQVSGRASFELVQKSAMAGIPVFGAVSAPSSLAVEMAEEAGITLVGFMRGESMNVYANPERLFDL